MFSKIILPHIYIYRLTGQPSMNKMGIEHEINLRLVYTLVEGEEIIERLKDIFESFLEV